MKNSNKINGKHKKKIHHIMSSDPSDFLFESDKLIKVPNGAKKRQKTPNLKGNIRGIMDTSEEKYKGNTGDTVSIIGVTGDAGPNQTTTTTSSQVSTNNNWNTINTKTVRDWKNSLKQALFVYNYVLEGLQKKLDKIKVVILFFSILTTVISAIATYALTNNNQTSIIVSLVINILTTLIGAVLSFLNGYIKIYNLDTTVQSYTVYIERMDSIYSDIAGELILPPSLRADALIFIKKEYDIYSTLIKNSPEIKATDNMEALKQYHTYLEDEESNIKFSSKYNNDAIIDMNG